MFRSLKYRYDLGEPVKICMVCANELRTDGELAAGLCENHQRIIIRPPGEVKRQFGRGIEYQLLCHTDELDDVIDRLESDDSGSDCLIFSRYIAGLFLTQLQRHMDLQQFDTIIYAGSGFVTMDIIFTEMGYLSEEDWLRDLFLQGEPGGELFEDENTDVVLGKRVLLLDLYRGMETRKGMDLLRRAGAGEVVTGYLTSYS